MVRLTPKTFLVLAVIVCLLSVGITFLVYLSWTTERVQQIPINLQIGDHWGINLENESLNFGVLPPGVTARREITLTGSDERTLVELHSTLYYVQPVANSFLLGPHEQRNVLFLATIPDNAQPGNYTGMLWIRLRKLHGEDLK